MISSLGSADPLDPPVICVRFGLFELNLKAGELRKNGLRRQLQQKPFQILEILLESPGEVVTREELRLRLWPDTHVGFDGSLNSAINTLRRTLGDSAANPRFIETLQRRGYRFIAPVERLAGILRNASQPGVTMHSVAVLPLVNEANDRELEYLSDGLTESIINSLSRIPGLKVMARSTMFRFRGQTPDPLKVGRDLSVSAVLTGRMLQYGEELSISIELVDANSGWRLFGRRYQRKLSDMLQFQEQISREISERLRSGLSLAEKRRLATLPTEDADAYRDYLKGRYFMNLMTQEGLRAGIAYFEKAIQKDPDYALAFVGLADCQGLLAFFSLRPPLQVMPKAKDAVLKAISIDDRLAEAHATLGSVLKCYDWNWGAAEREYRRALELNPNYPTGHHLYADFLSAMGRGGEAIQEIHRALELDPLSLVINMEMGWNFFMARDYDRAIEHSMKTLEMEPGFGAAHHTLGLAFEQLGKFEDSIQALKRSSETSGSNPTSLAALAHALAVAGRRQEAEAIFARLTDLAREAYVSPYLFALVHAGLEESDKGFDAIERAIEARDVWLVWLKRDPRFDSLRRSGRFVELLRRIGMTP